MSRLQLIAAMAGAMRGPKPDMALRGTRAEQVLAVVAAAAARGLPCPSNNALADAVGGQAHEVSRALSGLEERGLVTVRRAHKARQVTIVATGEATDWSLSGPAMRAFTAQAERFDGDGLSTAEIAARRVNSETCARCGVRLEVGCGHRPAPYGLSGSGWMGLNYV